MKKTYALFIQLTLGLLLSLPPYQAFAQKTDLWIRSYFKDIDVAYTSISETYDGGYLLSGWYGGSYPSYGWLLKTDINGKILWQKDIGLPKKVFVQHDLQTDQDGNIYIAAGTNELDDWFDPIVVKLNACGEKEWCRLISDEGIDKGAEIIRISTDGELFVSIPYHFESNDKRVSMMRMDTDGEVIWKNYYTQTIINTYSEEIRDILILPNGNLLLCGHGYFSPPGEEVGYLKALFICINPAGELIWEKVLDPDILGEAGSYHEAIRLEYSKEENLVYASLKTTYYQKNEVKSFLLSLTPEGEFISRQIIKTVESSNVLYPLAKISDSLFIGQMGIGELGKQSKSIQKPPHLEKGQTSFQDPHVKFRRGAFSRDIGNAVNDAVIFSNKGNIKKRVFLNKTFYSQLLRTHDNKFLFYYNTHPDTEEHPTAYLAKFNDQLQYDSIYTAPRDYDYLCSKEFIHDTISTQGCKAVGLDDLEQEELNAQLKAYPNPFAEDIHIQLPKSIRLNYAQYRQYRYQYKAETQLEVVDILGHIIYQQALQSQQDEVTINSQDWKQGIYLIRLVCDHQVVGKVKVIKE